MPTAITADRQLNLPLIGATRTLVANNTPMADNESLLLGTGEDASILYDGTSLVINPQLVGSGGVNITAGILFVNDTANASMTQGLTINQGAADNEILALKSSDVAHGLSTATGLTGAPETDTYFSIQKFSATEGGIYLAAFAEDLAGAGTGPSMLLYGFGGASETIAAAGALALINVQAVEHDGLNALVNTPANGLVFGVRGRTGAAFRSLFFVDIEGDLFVDGSTTITAFDHWDDWALCRAFDLERTPKQVIRDEWDQFVGYHRGDLVQAGIITAPPDGADGMWNLTQHVRLHNGAIVQLGKRIMSLEVENKALCQEVRALKGGLQ